jgi:hypothetical protein
MQSAGEMSERAGDGRCHHAERRLTLDIEDDIVPRDDVIAGEVAYMTKGPAGSQRERRNFSDALAFIHGRAVACHDRFERALGQAKPTLVIRDAERSAFVFAKADGNERSRGVRELVNLQNCAIF